MHSILDVVMFPRSQEACLDLQESSAGAPSLTGQRGRVSARPAIHPRVPGSSSLIRFALPREDGNLARESRGRGAKLCRPKRSGGRGQSTAEEVGWSEGEVGGRGANVTGDLFSDLF